MEPGAVDQKVTFISYASEDKKFVKNLADTLSRYHVAVWYDDYQIGIGDSIRQKINEGLSSSEYGVVVLSHNFFRKSWPKRELAALASLLEDGRILPVFLNITPEETARYDPLLGDVKGLRVDGDVRSVVAPIAAKVLGAAALTEDGRAVYRRRTVLVSELPLTERQAIEDMTFEECVIQGIAILNFGEGIAMSGCYEMHPRMFIVLKPPYAVTGAYGLHNVTFDRCRFKDIGFIVTGEIMQRFFDTSHEIPPGFEVPPHLQ